MAFSECFVGVPVTLNALKHPDYPRHALEIYVSIRSFVSLSPEKDNFCFCFPGIQTIGRKFGVEPNLVREVIAWLEGKGYLYRLPREQRSTTYTIVMERDLFLATLRQEGRERAIEANERWIREQQLRVRAKNTPRFRQRAV